MFTILCIDDNENNLFTLSAILEQIDDINIVQSTSAMDGLAVLLNQEVDLILLDIQMPEMDGFEAAKLIKVNKKTAHIPIIFLTAVFHSDEFQKKGFKIGAIEYLTKPIDDNMLLNKVRLFQRLIESEKKLRQQKEYMQAIIDLQNQMLLVIDKTHIDSANKRFFDFFGYSNLTAFTKEQNCVCKFFVEKEGFLPPSITGTDKEWLKIITNAPQKMHLAIVRRHDRADVIMSVDANLLDAQNELYVINLNDVTPMHRLQEQFRHDSLTDKLTGAFNRTKFDAVFENAILDISNQPFSVAILDIDHFKMVNDDFGHLCGDTVLQELVQLIEKNIRKEDLLSRWGGEEFTLIFFTSQDKIMGLLEKLRSLVENYSFSGVDRPITISAGVGEYKEGTDDKNSFLTSIDEALYKAKETGRNRIVTIEKK